MYDNVCKFLVEEFRDDLVTWLLGRPANLIELHPRELSLEPIRTDSLILLQSEDLILHIEFQTKPDQTIPFRMMDYRVRVYRLYPGKIMKQVVVYLKKTASELVYENSFKFDKTYHKFDVVRLWEQPTQLFLSNPGLLPFAILSQKEDKTELLREIAQKVDTIQDRRVQGNVAASASILAGLVLENDVITQLMRRDIMRESVVYQEIRREGLQEGRQEGIQQGRQEGIQQGLEQGLERGLEQGLERGKEVVAVNLLKAGMSMEQVVGFTGLSVELIQQLANRSNN